MKRLAIIGLALTLVGVALSVGIPRVLARFWNHGT